MRDLDAALMIRYGYNMRYTTGVAGGVWARHPDGAAVAGLIVWQTSGKFGRRRYLGPGALALFRSPLRV